MTKSALFSRFLTDDDKEQNGVWIDFGDGIRVKVRRLKSKRSLEVRKELEKPFLDQIRRGPLPSDTAEELLLQQMSRGLIVDWEGIDLGDGEVVSYSPARAYDVLKALPEFRDSIFSVCVDADNYRAQIDEDAEKN